MKKNLDSTEATCIGPNNTHILNATRLVVLAFSCLGPIISHLVCCGFGLLLLVVVVVVVPVTKWSNELLRKETVIFWG
jgi:hypothetical protein